MQIQIVPNFPPRAHQQVYLDNYVNREYFALIADMGTGKTYMVLMNVCYLWAKKKCDALLVIAPNGVHHAWVDIEIPKHMPIGVPFVAAAWSATESKADAARRAVVMAPHGNHLRILTMNWEALQTKRGHAVADEFLSSAKSAFMACDESDCMKNPKSARWKSVMQLRSKTSWRRIMSGTPIDGTPFSAFAQYNFLHASILNTSSYTAFKAEYAEMMQYNDPLMKAIIAKNRLRFLPQIVKQDRQGKPKYKNLEKLAKIIAPHSYRVLKKDCLDLPDKIYKTIPFDLTKEQAAAYKLAANEGRLLFNDEPTAFNKLAIATKLSQITSGYYLHPEANEPVRIPGGNPKLDLTIGRVAAALAEGHKVIIWARYTIQIQDLVAALKALTEEDTNGRPVSIVEYYGGVAQKDRRAGVEEFERGSANVFVGNQQAGGTGLTLIAATVVAYFSNNYSLRDRLQSEDRPHRIGQTKSVTYFDFVARKTVDVHAVNRLIQKKEVADYILDPHCDIFDVKF